MIALAGNFFLLVSLIFPFGAILLAGSKRISLFYCGASAPIIAVLLLIFGFVTSDFSLKNVFLNSSTILPLTYKIAASWASHEGSMLLWLGLLALISMVYIYLASFSQEAREFAIIILSCVQVLFASFILFTSNPFEAFAFASKEGLGLNPTLQDMALSIHPPLLYLGNLSYIALFVSGYLLLYRPKEQAEILALSQKFSNFALMTVTAGIGLGSWWAYRELGWGGYWFFDPVENISLMPWLSGIALQHFLLVTAKNGKYLRCTIALSMLCFLLVIYGTFFVRSGIISSVHSFAFSPQRGLYIFSICLVLTTLSVVWFVIKTGSSFPLRRESIAKQAEGLDLTSSYSACAGMKARAILLGNLLWLAALLSLIVALIYPVYYSFLFGIDIAIDPEYFTTIFVPLGLPILLLAAIAPFIKSILSKKQGIIGIIAIMLTLLLTSKVEFGIISASICFAAIFLMIQMLDYLLLVSNNFTKTIPLNKCALFLGHFGFGLLAFTIIINSLLTKEVEFVGKIGDSVSNKNISVTLENMKFAQISNYYRQIAIFQIEDASHNIVTLKPENRLYKVENTLSQEVDIYSFILHDVYAVLSQIDKDIIHAKIYYQPLISFIWLAICIICSGFLLLLFRRTATS